MYAYYKETKTLEHLKSYGELLAMSLKNNTSTISHPQLCGFAVFLNYHALLLSLVI